MKVIVTGCGGFLGSEIVRQLIDCGHRVVGIARSESRQLVDRGMIEQRGDLTDVDFVRQTIRDADAVIHTAARAGVWGRREDYDAINHVATRHVIDAARRGGVDKLVFTSSPSVTFAGKHQSGVNESEPYPERHLCHYSETKMLGEQAVILADCSGGLRTVSLRPHLIWGDDDPHLIPRLIARAKSGRLRIVGDGTNKVDTVHVVNAAAAHLDALKVLSSDPDRIGGRCFFISQEEPVVLWDWVESLCRLHGVQPPTKRISLAAAWRLGATFETVYRMTGRQSEPPMTRFVAAQLALDHYFDISAARNLLGYEPKISLAAGFDSLAKRVGRQAVA
jgi:2-alkyl-3-oxoalkanoate reductase